MNTEIATPKPMLILPPNKPVRCEIQIEGGKSESNRALMIAAYGGFTAELENLSASDDTRLLQSLLHDIAEAKPNTMLTLDCGLDGTACRFLTTYLAGKKGQWLLTGNERMRLRPIGALVEALRDLGAKIEYAECQGAVPLRITGVELSGTEVHIDMSRSSQFASSLLLAAPCMEQGLHLHLDGVLNSLPYLDMTIELMNHFGVDVKRDDRLVTVRPKLYIARPYAVPSDWSSASYWYEIAALSNDCDIFLRHLDTKTAHGDAVMARLAESFGVQSEIGDLGVRLTKQATQAKAFQFDFAATPDLFPTVAAICAGLQIPATFTGLSNLAVKESNRIDSMAAELGKFGTRIERVGTHEIHLTPGIRLDKSPRSLPRYSIELPLRFNAHGDHRIAMALAPLSMVLGAIAIDNPDVVTKSYLNYWEDLRKTGMTVTTGLMQFCFNRNKS